MYIVSIQNKNTNKDISIHVLTITITLLEGNFLKKETISKNNMSESIL